MTPLNAVVLGAGNRGSTYGSFAVTYPQELQIVAVAEPRADRRAAASPPPTICRRMPASVRGRIWLARAKWRTC